MPADATPTCRDCGGALTFSEDERLAFAALGHEHTPSRCASCRTARKTRQAENQMRPIAPRFREFQQMRTTVICSSCGESATVPFAARAGRSVYCSTCFERRRQD